MKYAKTPRPGRTLWRVVDHEDKPVPGELHGHFGRAMEAAALLDVTHFCGSYSVRAEVEEIPTWKAVA